MDQCFDTRPAVQGAGQMLGAVVAFYAELQPLPADNLIRQTTAIWPLEAAMQAWETWTSYNTQHNASQLVDRTVIYAVIPEVGMPLPIALLLAIRDCSDAAIRLQQIYMALAS